MALALLKRERGMHAASARWCGHQFSLFSPSSFVFGSRIQRILEVAHHGFECVGRRHQSDDVAVLHHEGQPLIFGLELIEGVAYGCLGATVIVAAAIASNRSLPACSAS